MLKNISEILSHAELKCKVASCLEALLDLCWLEHENKVSQMGRVQNTKKYSQLLVKIKEHLHFQTGIVWSRWP